HHILLFIALYYSYSNRMKGLLGSCVVIPCSYNYPDPKTNTTGFTGIWYNDNNEVICHFDKSQTSDQFQNRTKLLGDLSKKNCSLMIEDLQQSDGGPLYFRIEIKDYELFSYSKDKISVSVIGNAAIGSCLTCHTAESQIIVKKKSTLSDCYIFLIRMVIFFSYSLLLTLICFLY
uniref:Immunoglobulin V-set domain-containing protein n=1 Tax=Oreochromis niloticus TaxID=8128 RepID=A0A669BQR4_ORENI